MGNRATAGTCLASLVRMAMPLCKQAERECPRTGPSRKPEIPDWVLAVLIMVAVLERRKAKSAQYRLLKGHRRQLAQWLGTGNSPTIFSASFFFPLQNSETKTAAANPTGTATAMAIPASVSAPDRSARIPYDGRTSEVGLQFGLVRNSRRSSSPKSTGTASRKMKKKIASTKKIALQPQIRISHSMPFSRQRSQACQNGARRAQGAPESLSLCCMSTVSRVSRHGCRGRVRGG